MFEIFIFYISFFLALTDCSIVLARILSVWECRTPALYYNRRIHSFLQPEDTPVYPAASWGDRCETVETTEGWDEQRHVFYNFQTESEGVKTFDMNHFTIVRVGVDDFIIV
jgi:hypothetical protein